MYFSLILKLSNLSFAFINPSDSKTKSDLEFNNLILVSFRIIFELYSGKYFSIVLFLSVSISILGMEPSNKYDKFLL